MRERYQLVVVFVKTLTDPPLNSSVDCHVLPITFDRHLIGSYPNRSLATKAILRGLAVTGGALDRHSTALGAAT